MCLAVPAKIESIEGERAVVSLGATRTEALLSLVPQAKVGDWILLHAGFAISLLDEKEALETYELLQSIEVEQEPT
jgi:hydrogenase expression/formation protein HypC